MFGVANVAEAQALRVALGGSETPIFILGTALPHEREAIVHGGFVPAVSSVPEAEAFGACSLKNVRVHLAVDSGMGRIGVWQDEAAATARAITALPNVELAGVATHLPVADEDEAFTQAQLARFEALLTELHAAGLRVPVIHSLNSAGVIRFARHAQTMVRAGLMLYGSAPIADFQNELRAVMTLKTRVTLIRAVGAGRGISYGRTFIAPKPMRVATLGIGYADGYQRRLSNTGAHVLIRGTRCALLGRVTMDQIMADVTHLPGLEPGEETVLIGRQGDEEIFAADLARRAQTIAWEIFTGIGSRVERVLS